MNKRWIVLFSQTGSEIAALANELGRWPDIIITNNFVHEGWEKNIPPELVHIMQPSAIYEWLRNIESHDTIITLHGYLKIMPPDLCEKFEIYNGHPAAIDLYPELRGKDPQEKAWEGNYGMIGSVVHRCTPVLDAGEIVKSVHYVNRCYTKEDLYNKLKESSFMAWRFFFEENKI